MRYEGNIYRPPSEADSLILQATIGCSWNRCTYCVMYTDKRFRERPPEDCVEDLERFASRGGGHVEKLFVADGDALAMSMEGWTAVLEAARRLFPRLRRVSCYATAVNILEKSQDELRTLREGGLDLLYVGPESGDDETLKRIAKGATAAQHVEAAGKAHEAGLKLSVIAMLGVAGKERSETHAKETARLITAMDPEYLAALTTTVVPGTPLEKLQRTGRFELPSVEEMLRELRIIVGSAQPTDALFRTNHASNYLPLGGRLPQDRERITATIDSALEGEIRLRPEWLRGL
ncbi:MAG: radical SAM protein [Myxococcota bacterium]